MYIYIYVYIYIYIHIYIKYKNIHIYTYITIAQPEIFQDRRGFVELGDLYRNFVIKEFWAPENRRSHVSVTETYHCNSKLCENLNWKKTSYHFFFLFQCFRKFARKSKSKGRIPSSRSAFVRKFIYNLKVLALNTQHSFMNLWILLLEGCF